MASSAAALSANSCSTNMRLRFFNNDPYRKQQKQNLNFFKIRASSSDEQDDCNVEECAPDKEVGKVSMEWLAGEKTKVAGTFPPRRREWSGYVEKDTAGQTNIYSVEPAVYVAESAISSGSSGTSADGAENTAALVGFSGIIAVAAASVILLQVGKNSPPPIKTFDYAGPSLSYYITKFKPSEIVPTQASDEIPESSIPTQASDAVMSSTSAETPESSVSVPVPVPQIDSEASIDSTTDAVTSTSTEKSEETAIATPQALEVEVGSG
ncbi:protein MAINTENANCE OF PSII UNDER HIGH LIGHT 1 [Lactuca sativa]|uniref:Protein MAINTENANCE OF PSII UNDER HIGH LIGHT 1 n=1 Tax=Lactuca sativa TaxID=4236 RepID=A0A9R1WVL0_LACSA|nr:protein MAINTENANCE OF PSII UNDER HIGH LIGHT 1 [Lactuca sativa]KAJ0187127.1 hypothetical protein LSAT_V11C900486860 [Lactuca sativa]